MNLKELKELITLFEEAEVTELEIEREGIKIRLKKGNDKIDAQAIVPSGATVTPVISEKEEKVEKKKEAEETLVKIEAPMVGTFYSSPSPEAPPFVEEGAVIEKGQVLCIIEAMKLMNEIKSEVKGKIKKILVENGHTVEFGDSLFLIEPLA
ncbi:MAG: acetyl-CoA carboxylase biotin carboxyl carrier protein [Candidatus Omnitrophica bacterium]|nr:acetyl-CoA carboxylase biotin carboxyl carrier protein [Candidatus Omnitrophota bacterium]